MRIFRDLEFVEKLGSGIHRILKHYGKEIFHISDNFVEITFPFNFSLVNKNGGQVGGQIGGQIEKLTKRQQEILDLIIDNPSVSRKELSNILEINESAIQKHLNALKSKNHLQREGNK